MSSLEIAKLTGKRHDNVVRDIDKLTKDISSDLRTGFKSSTYINNGRSYRCYELDKDSTLCLLAGYDANARMKIIKRWQELESAAAKPVLPYHIRRYELNRNNVPAGHWSDEFHRSNLSHQQYQELRATQIEYRTNPKTGIPVSVNLKGSRKAGQNSFSNRPKTRFKTTWTQQRGKH
jgi:hypothetical protein